MKVKQILKGLGIILNIFILWTIAVITIIPNTGPITFASQSEANKIIIASTDFEKLELATIQIKIGQRGGAGVLIEDDGEYLYALTVKHAVTQKGRLDVCVRDTNGKFHIVKGIKEIYKHKVVDLALIKIPKPEDEYKILRVAYQKPKKGTKIYTIGHPLNFYFTITEGIVSNYLTNPLPLRKGTYMLISAQCFTGNSGGPVINEKTEVVGIASGIMYLGNNPHKYQDTTYLFYMTFAVQLDDIKELMKEALPKVEIPELPLTERHKILQ